MGDQHIPKSALTFNVGALFYYMYQYNYVDFMEILTTILPFGIMVLCTINVWYKCSSLINQTRMLEYAHSMKGGEKTVNEIAIADEYYSVVWYKEQYGFKRENDAIKCAEKLTRDNPNCNSAIIIAWRKSDEGSFSRNYYEVRIFTWISGSIFTNMLVDFL